MRHRVKGQRHFDTSQLPANERRGLVGHWIGGGSGYTWTDRSGLGNHGTLTNGPLWKLGVGGYRSSIYLDGVNDYVAVSSTSDLQFSSGDKITISAWVKPSSFGNYSTVLIKDRTAGSARGNYAFRIGNGASDQQKLTFYYASALNTYHVYQADADSFNTTDWWHIAVTYTFATASSAQLYINGQAVAGSWVVLTGSSAPLTAADPLWIGANKYGAGITERFNGQVDDVRIYNRVLSQAEIVNMARRTSNTVQPRGKRSVKLPGSTFTGVGSTTGIGSVTF